jgi:hypothetical protein
MLKNYMMIILIVVFLIAFSAVYHFLFSIYEVEVKTNFIKNYSGDTSDVKVSVIPINSLGKKIIFRKVHAEFEITSGANFADIILCNKKKGKMVLRVNRNRDVIIVRVKSKYALMPSEVEIPDSAD